MGGSVIQDQITVRLRVNGRDQSAPTEARTLLSDFLRHSLGLTGTHVGCEHGVCGACTILLDGEATRSCLVFAVQCEGAEVVTVEGLAAEDGTLHPLQEAFREAHALQCGFCTPGFLMSLLPLYDQRQGVAQEHGADEQACAGQGTVQQDTLEQLDDATIREALSGNLCRCTGYQNIVEAVRNVMGPSPSGGSPSSSDGEPTAPGGK